MQIFCLGDSITDSGHLFINPPLGDGYVHKLSLKLQQRGTNCSITNLGMNGFTISRLLDSTLPRLPKQTDIIILPGCNHGNGMYKQTEMYQKAIELDDKNNPLIGYYDMRIAMIYDLGSPEIQDKDKAFDKELHNSHRSFGSLKNQLYRPS